MSVSALNNRLLALMGGAAVVGGVVSFNTVGTAAEVGSIGTKVGGIILLAAAVFAAYRYHSKPSPIPISRPNLLPRPVRVPDGDFLPPLTLKPIVFRKVAICIAGSDEKSSVSQVFNIAALVQTVASFLSAEDTAIVERTCVAWSRSVPGTLAWKPKCDQEGIPPIKRREKNPLNGEEMILHFYKEAYLRLRPMIFGPRQYSDYLHVKTIGEIRRLKESIHADIYHLDPSYMEPLPLRSNAKRKYRLIYLSKEIEELPLNSPPKHVLMTINQLGKLALQAQKPTKYNPISDFVSNQMGDKPLDCSDWVLMSAEIIPETRNASFQDQVTILSTLGARPPKAIEAIALNFFNYFRFGIHLFRKNPWTFSRGETTVTIQGIQYRVAVGAFGPLGLSVSYSNVDDDSVGMPATFSCGD